MKHSLITFLLILGFAWDCSAQSIADAARKERERQKQVHSVITVTGTTATTAAGTATTAAAPAAATEAAAKSGPTDNKGHDEKYWRAAFQKARDDIKHADDQISLLDSKVRDLNTQFLQRDDIYNKENRLGPLITETQKQLDDARKEGEAARQRIADLEEDLRRSGGPAGWAR
jgi:TolA-binding protein